MAVPAPIPVTVPVLPDTAATPELLLVQAPPVASSLSASVVPTHSIPLPLIAVGVVFTVIVFVAAQPPPANV